VYNIAHCVSHNLCSFTESCEIGFDARAGSNLMDADAQNPDTIHKVTPSEERKVRHLSLLVGALVFIAVVLLCDS
jgi:hypothetical protein